MQEASVTQANKTRASTPLPAVGGTPKTHRWPSTERPPI